MERVRRQGDDTKESCILTEDLLQVEARETIAEAGAREVREECGYIVRTEDLGESYV